MCVDAMASMTPLRAAGMAVYFGAATEHGLDPYTTAFAVISRLRELLVKIVNPAPEGDPAQTQQELSLAVRLFSQSAVSFLSKSVDIRKNLSADKEFMSLLQDAQSQVGPDWVYGVLIIRSGQLIVLIPKSGFGVKVGFTNVNNNFHLFTLLQGVLGPALDLDLADHDLANRTAVGQLPVDGKVSDQAIWNYCNYRNVGTTFSPLNFVWGEGSTDEILTSMARK